MKKLTPMMQQYVDIKNQYPDTFLFFRLGDFYELFFDDAKLASRELEIALTARDCGLAEKAPMCGVPHHSVDKYIDRLIKKGYKVAMCDQVEEASQAVGIVKRDVVRVITPGTVIDTNLLDEKKNNYLMSIYLEEKCGISYVDISTGELFTTEISGNSVKKDLINEIAKIMPREVIIPDVNFDAYERILAELKNIYKFSVNQHYSWTFELSNAINRIKEHFNVLSIDGLGLVKNKLSTNATGAIIDYLKSTQKRHLEHISAVNSYSLSDTMALDLSTRINLELTETIRGKSKAGSLLSVLDKTKTSMGGRLLRKWIESPLIVPKQIDLRLDAVSELFDDVYFKNELVAVLKNIYDIERLAVKISFGSANPRDLISLKNSLQYIPKIKSLLENKEGMLGEIYEELDLLEDVTDLIEKAIIDEPSVGLKEGGIIKTGFSDDVDELNAISKDGKAWIASLESKERDSSSIKNLKIGYNKIFGYYIEVTKSNLSNVPDHYIRKQTLANCERYITPELKEMEAKILSAKEKLLTLEYNLFLEIRSQIGTTIDRLKSTARAVSKIDVLASFAQIALDNRYIKPIITEGTEIKIESGRHPVVERMLDNDIFVPNDTIIDNEKFQISIITGPNMAGKSTYMRQVSLIVLMAQIGSFVPAYSAEIGVTDRIFTRVGASDDLSQGQSTFMVEMSEMANILNSATDKSLLILDEIGRGTSTFDGLSIAWAVVEYISEKNSSRTLFSTHYHEITELETRVKGVKNYRISVKEEGDNIIFLRKIEEGSADKSYGIQVAKLAGLPKGVIKKASKILKRLEKNDIARRKNGEIKNDVVFVEETVKENNEQLSFSEIHLLSLTEELNKIDINNTTPFDALNILAKLKEKFTLKIGNDTI
ncbi:MAG: DNA mismatch repair protein MutS [Clostridiales bacterium]|nr:DNA mismatch repair protein MutS [Clostridiales bacterium]